MSVPVGRPNAIDKHVGGRVRMRRIALDMSQSDLAAAVGVSFQQIQKYETGSNRIGAGRLQQIGKALRVPIQSFYDGAPGGFDGRRKVMPDAFMSFFATRQGKRLIMAFDRITTPRLRRDVLALVEMIGARSDKTKRKR
jgi:transcriptional regulator with XRE-family HTH domain